MAIIVKLVKLTEMAAQRDTHTDTHIYIDTHRHTHIQYIVTLMNVYISVVGGHQMNVLLVV